MTFINIGNIICSLIMESRDNKISCFWCLTVSSRMNTLKKIHVYILKPKYFSKNSAFIQLLNGFFYIKICLWLTLLMALLVYTSDNRITSRKSAFRATYKTITLYILYLSAHSHTYTYSCLTGDQWWVPRILLLLLLLPTYLHVCLPTCRSTYL